jgi:putative endonuclease
MSKCFYVYILASRYRGTMYVGVTNNVDRRLDEHKAGIVPGFTKRYKVNRLVCVEEYASIAEARARERVLKRLRRAWKFKLIEVNNPSWRDLSDMLRGVPRMRCSTK